jgi:predicted enzyme related to lactoylglutathione lyase
MTDGITAIIYPVTDLVKAKDLFTALLGTQPNMDEPYYVNFGLGELDLGLDPHGHHKGMTGPVVYWSVDDIASAVHKLLDAGGQALDEVKDVGGGKLIATVKDADGNVIGLTQPG